MTELLIASEANALYGELTGKPYKTPHSIFEAMARRGFRITHQPTISGNGRPAQAVTEAQVRAFAASKINQPIRGRKPRPGQGIVFTSSPANGRRGRKKSALKRARTVEKNGRYKAEQCDGYVYLRRVVDCPALFDDEEWRRL